MAAAAAWSKPRYVPLCRLLLVAALVFAAGGIVVGAAGAASSPPTTRVLLLTEQTQVMPAAGGRRMLVGSRAPTCTYNECRGCRLRCSVQVVPVDASDPINSAYHYKCICRL
ncbi:hypothetical protein GQ55_6G260500 [Panicum hallii var. hallii]|uniref:Stomagen C-terminal domain-containing protein n=1 Tax=Panicum hallii var. hallii TaxID=1504633 RepID=A0A2T7D9Q8_9POAL|nr:hypothetical protein GQ55_6G260500 [Panicum hallii var. hallii]